jgi:hypothetical protein
MRGELEGGVQSEGIGHRPPGIFSVLGLPQVTINFKRPEVQNSRSALLAGLAPQGLRENLFQDYLPALVAAGFSHLVAMSPVSTSTSHCLFPLCLCVPAFFFF